MAGLPGFPDTNAIALRNDRFDPIWLGFFAGILRAFRERDAEGRVVVSDAAPTASDIPDGEGRDWHNTATNTTVRAVNIGGVVKTITYI